MNCHKAYDPRWSQHHLYIGSVSGKGVGVFCKESIQKNDVIELCPSIKIPSDQRTLIDQTVLGNYFYVRKDHGVSAVLGFGMLYNHSYHPNANFIWDMEEKFVEIVALRDIPPGEEIVFNYWGVPECQDPMWFENVVDQ